MRFKFQEQNLIYTNFHFLQTRFFMLEGILWWTHITSGFNVLNHSWKYVSTFSNINQKQAGQLIYQVGLFLVLVNLSATPKNLPIKYFVIKTEMATILKQSLIQKRYAIHCCHIFWIEITKKLQLKISCKNNKNFVLPS